jgi:hypothetical protein
LCNRFLHHKRGLVTEKTLSVHSWYDYHRTCQKLLAVFGDGRLPRGRKDAAGNLEAIVKSERKRLPKMALPIAKAEAGSLPAAVKLKCLDCAGWVKQEVRDCAIRKCPLFPHRPFQIIRSGNPNDLGADGMTTVLRERIGLPTAASTEKSA